MNITIAEKPEFSQIPAAYAKLGRDSINQLISLSLNKSHAFNPSQLAFVCELCSFRSENFEEILLLIKAFLEHLPKNQVNIALELENYLAVKVLKRFENQKSYSKFFTIFDEFYKKNVQPTKKIHNLKARGVLFFVMAPVFLAHTKPLFDLIANEGKTSKITIASLASEESFSKRCKAQNINFIELQGDTYLQKLEHLENIAGDHQITVWQCSPQFLSYFSTRRADVVWWSHKFNPPISGVKKYITHLPSNKDVLKISGCFWHNFTAPHNLKNNNKSPAEWISRKGKIAAFCREELIDEERYWSTLAAILERNKNAVFQYCGRRPIHQPWVEKFRIDPLRIIFKGWLDDPEKEILKVALILDTYQIRHGVMGQEAAIGGIPIIFPRISDGFGGIEDLYQSLVNKKGLSIPVTTSSFDNANDASNMVAQLAFDEQKNRVLALSQQKIIKRIPSAGTFKQFMGLIGS